MPEPIKRPMFGAFKNSAYYLRLAAIGPIMMLGASIRILFSGAKGVGSGWEKIFAGLMIAAYPVIQAAAFIALPFTMVASIFTGFAALGEAGFNKIKSIRQQKMSFNSQNENSTLLMSRSTIEKPAVTRNEEAVKGKSADFSNSRLSEQQSSMFASKPPTSGFQSWETVDNVMEQFRGYSSQARLWVLSGDFRQAKGSFDRATSYMNTLDAEWEKNKSQFTEKNIQDYWKIRKEFYDPLVSNTKLHDQPSNRM